MAKDARDAALALRGVLDLAGPYVALRLRKRENQNPLYELFHRVKSCRLCVLRVHQLLRCERLMSLRDIAAAERARLGSHPRQHRSRIRRRNRTSNRMLQETFLFMESFYWNATRAAECAGALGLVRGKTYEAFDAVKIRHDLIEHQKQKNWPSRPSISIGSSPAIKPASSTHKPLLDPDFFAHARRFAVELSVRIQAQIGGANG